MTRAWNPEAVVHRLAALQEQQECWRTHEVVGTSGAHGHARLDNVPAVAPQASGANGDGAEAPSNGDGAEAPSSLAAALTMRAVLRVLHDRRLDLPFDHNVHAAQSLQWCAPITVGSAIETRAWIGAIRERARAVFFDVETESRTGNDQVCLRGRSTQALRHG